MSTAHPKTAIPLIPAITTEPGRYLHITEEGTRWEYTYDIHAKGTKSERRIGQLHADRLQHLIDRAKPGDRIETPWGTMLRMPDSPYERGFLLEHAGGQPIDTSHGQPVAVPAALLDRGGRWKAMVGPWHLLVMTDAMGSRSERRIGRLHFGSIDVLGAKQGDYIDAPWGRLRWMGRVDVAATTDYEQGLLLRGAHDRSLDDLTGQPIFPSSQSGPVRLESCYLDGGLRATGSDQAAHALSLSFKGNLHSDVEVVGTLTLDPNHCSLNSFGDRESCTKMAVRCIDVSIVRQRLADPTQLNRRYFQVTGEGLAPSLGLIAYPTSERYYLKLDQQVVPLYPTLEPALTHIT